MPEAVGPDLVGPIERKVLRRVVRLKGRCRPEELRAQIREAWLKSGLPVENKPRS